MLRLPHPSDLSKAQLTLELLQRHRAVTARVQLAEDVADPIHAWNQRCVIGAEKTRASMAMVVPP